MTILRKTMFLAFAVALTGACDAEPEPGYEIDGAGEVEDRSGVGFRFNTSESDPRVVESRVFGDEQGNPTALEVHLVTRKADGTAGGLLGRMQSREDLYKLLGYTPGTPWEMPSRR